MFSVADRILARIRNVASAIWKALAPSSELAAALVDTIRTRNDLLLENAVLRHQVVVLRRQTRRPALTVLDRLRLLLAARLVHGWRRAIAIVQPETILRWHRLGLRLFWRYKSKAAAPARLSGETVALIREMATNNRLWGTERIRGELLKLGIFLSKRTIQKYIRQVRDTRPRGQSWATFLSTHGHAIWSCDFVQSYDLLFRPVFLFFLVHLGSRRIVHIAATRNPSHEWTAQQIRNATMDGTVPRFLIRDRDDKFGATFDRAAQGVGIRVVKTAVRTPNMNAIAERFAGSLRRELLDHLLVVDDHHLARIGREYATFFNRARPHQGIGQRVPDGTTTPNVNGQIIAYPVLGGLHHDYRKAA
jgi:putative transposase